MNRYTTEARTATGRDLFKDKKKKKAKEVSSDIPTAIQLGEHGRYQIKSGRLAGEFVARAFPKPPTNARGLIAEARGASEEEAIAALHDVIDARETRAPKVAGSMRRRASRCRASRNTSKRSTRSRFRARNTRC
jgi:hypothetical protein